MMKRNLWRALKVAAVLAVVFDFLTPDMGLIGGVFDPAVGEAHAAGTLPANTFMYTPVNPTALSSLTTAKMLGVGLANGFVPHYDGVALVTFAGTVANGTASLTTTLTAVYGTGTPPSNAGTFAGTACGNPVVWLGNASTAAAAVPFSVTCVVNGLALGTGYWFDMAAASSSSATVTVTNMTIDASEQ